MTREFLHISTGGSEGKPVFVFSAETKKFIRRYKNATMAAKLVGMGAKDLYPYIRKERPINGYILSYHEQLSQKFDTRIA